MPRLLSHTRLAQGPSQGVFIKSVKGGQEMQNVINEGPLQAIFLK